MPGYARDDTRLVAVRVEASGSAAEMGDPAMLEAQAHEVAEVVEGVFVDRLRLCPVDRALSDDAANDLVALMRRYADTAGFRDEARVVLAELRAALPKKSCEVLDDDVLDELIETGIDTMALRLGAREGGEE